MLFAWLLHFLRSVSFPSWFIIFQNFPTKIYLLIYLPIYQFISQTIIQSIWLFSVNKIIQQAYANTNAFISYAIFTFWCMHESVLKRLHCFDAYSDCLSDYTLFRNDMHYSANGMHVNLKWYRIHHICIVPALKTRFTQQPNGCFEWQYSVLYKQIYK